MQNSKVYDQNDIIEYGKPDKHRNKKGMNWVITGLFVVGELAGGGIVALPSAMMLCGIGPGITIALILSIFMGFTAHLLGRSWVILQTRWPQYREHCRKPYAEIALRAIGPAMKLIVSICIDVTQFGAAVVFLLLSSKNINDLSKSFFDYDFSFCYLIFIVGILLMPILLLKSPQDFWWAVVVAMLTTAGAVILIIVGSALDYGTCSSVKGTNDKLLATNFFIAFGTFVFSYGGHSMMPTAQHDMRKPYHFTRSAALCFTVIQSMYMPVMIMGYVTYGNSIQSSIVNSIQTISIHQAINVLITIHVVLALTVIFNPLNQELEEAFNIPHHFCWQRALLRGVVMLAAIVVAETLPTFGPLLNLIGGSTVSLTSIVFPCIFYLYIKAGEQRSLEKDVKNVDEPVSFTEMLARTPKLRLLACGIIIVVGLAGGAAATFSAILDLATTQFSYPCYVRPFLNLDEHKSSTSFLDCCGEYQNITRSGDTSLCHPYKDFYNQQD